MSSPSTMADGELENDEKRPSRGTLPQPFSCTRCRQRKVRCDRQQPCMQCDTIELECTYPTRRKERKKGLRTLSSRSRQEQTDHLDKRISGVASQIEHLQRAVSEVSDTLSARALGHSAPVSTSVSTSVSACVSTVNTPGPPANMEGETLAVDKPDFEEDPSLATHAIFVNEFLHDVVGHGSGTLDHLNVEFEPDLELLRRLVNPVQPYSTFPTGAFVHKRTLDSRQTFSNLPMPPIELAVTSIRMAQENPRLRFLWFAEFMPIANFNTYFFKVYSPGATVTAADYIIVNAGLHWLFRDCSMIAEDQKLVDDFQEHANACQENLETILASLPFHLPVSLDWMCALVLACRYCLEICRPSIAWNFIVSASQMSQALGYHLGTNDKPQVRRLQMDIFWDIYITEKSLALRLGRSSTIQDCAITIPYSRPALDSRNFYLPRWIDLSRIQGKIYELLYSHVALSRPEAERTHVAKRLASDLVQLTQISPQQEHLHRLARRSALGDNLDKLMQWSDELIALSTLVLVYRAIPMQPNSHIRFCEECIQISRKALQCHEKCLDLISSSGLGHLDAYIKWVLVYSPFVPFIVLFCFVLETSELADLTRLETFVSKLPCWDFLPHKADSKHHRLYKVLFSIVRKYTDAKSSSATNPLQAEVQGDFNRYLNALLLGPRASASHSSHHDAVRPDESTATDSTDSPAYSLLQHRVTLENLHPSGGDDGWATDSNPSTDTLSIWFQSNQHIFGLLEE